MAEPKYFPEIDKFEHDDELQPYSKRVTLYGLDTESAIPTKRAMAVDPSGNMVASKPNYQTKVVESGGYIYFCYAPVGTPEATAGWKIARFDAAGSRMYANADASFTNVATDPTSLTYEYS